MGPRDSAATLGDSLLAPVDGGEREDVLEAVEDRLRSELSRGRLLVRRLPQAPVRRDQGVGGTGIGSRGGQTASSGGAAG